MKVRVTATSETGHKISHDHDLKDEGQLTKAIAILLDEYKKSGESIYGMRIKVDH